MQQDTLRRCIHGFRILCPKNSYFCVFNCRLRRRTLLQRNEIVNGNKVLLFVWWYLKCIYYYELKEVIVQKLPELLEGSGIPTEALELGWGVLKSGKNHFYQNLQTNEGNTNQIQNSLNLFPIVVNGNKLSIKTAHMSSKFVIYIIIVLRLSSDCGVVSPESMYIYPLA